MTSHVFMIYFVTVSLLIGANFEVHFKGEHVMHSPWTSYTGTSCKKEVEVKMLRHVTHFSEADCIIHDNKGKDYQIQFKAFRKCGKDGSTMKTYRSESPSIEPGYTTMYEPVSSNDDLFPGCYSWWSPVEDEDQHSSLFGTIEFSAKVDDLIECYKKAFNPPLKKIQFRCGGTLRYRNQACKVIIICSKIFRFDLPNKEYPEMPMMTEREIKLQYNDPKGSNTYDSFAFIFYFPREHMQMNCPEQAIICKQVPHYYKKCATKGRSCSDHNEQPPKQLSLKLENMKKRREEKTVSLESAHIALSTLENEKFKVEMEDEKPKEETEDEKLKEEMEDEKLKEEMEDEKLKEEMEDKEMKYNPSMPKKRKRNDEDDNDDDDLGPILKKSGLAQY